MINYILQVLFFQLLFLAVYDVFLKKETFFQWNRFYLITSSILAYFIPFMQIRSVGNYLQQAYQLPDVILNPQAFFLNEVVLGSKESVASSTTIFTLENVYFLGLIAMFGLFLFKIIQIIKKIKTNKIIKKPNYKLVVLNDNHAFSFFDYIFLGKSILKKDYQHILKHELTHVKQKHSLDLLFFEIQKIVFWFNPFSYLFQHRISTLHEFIADAKTIATKDKSSFFENLLQQSFNVEKITFVNNYYKKSLLKKRIIMATKNKSKQILKMKYLLVLPLIMIMFVYVSCNENEINKNPQVYKLKNLDKVPYLLSSTETDNENRKEEIIQELITLSFENVVEIDSVIDELFYIEFIVDKDGNNSSFNYENIPKEFLSKAKQLTTLVPKINAGIKNNKTVDTKLTIPLIVKSSQEIVLKEVIPFTVIDKVPVYPSCKNLKTNSERSNCFNEKIKKHVTENFDIKLAQNLGLTAGKKKINVQFKINKNGVIENIKARAPHLELQKEAIRIIKLLPQMQAGEQEGRKVSVRYNLPIIFNIEDINKKESPRFGAKKNEFNKVNLAGTIRDEFGYLILSKRTLKVSTIGAIDFSTKKKFNAVSFNININGLNKGLVIGNKINKKVGVLIDKLEVGSQIKIYNIIVASKENVNIEPIHIKIKN